MHWTTSLTIHD